MSQKIVRMTFFIDCSAQNFFFVGESVGFYFMVLTFRLNLFVKNLYLAYLDSF